MVSQYEGIKEVVHVSTDVFMGCRYCDERVGGDIAPSINHYINAHGFKLLHVGTETSHSDEGKPWHSTVAVLGK